MALGSVLVSLGGLAVSSFIKSPAEAAADTRPPQPSLITAPVVRQILQSTTVLRGTFTSGHGYPVLPTSVAATAAGPGGGPLVVTRIKVAAGEPVRSGQVLAEVSGRPVFTLVGSVPVYRDMLPDESGADIAQLQDDLRAAGIPTGGDRSGWFGPGTKSAVSVWYRRIGYPVPLTGAATMQAVQAAAQAVQQQEQTVLELTTGRGTTGGGASPAPGASGTGQGGSGGTPAVQLAQARALLAQDRATLAQAEAANGPELPASELVFLPRYPARVENVAAQVGDHVSASLMQLTAGGLTLTGRLAPADAPLVKAGMRVTVLDESTGVSTTGRVGAIGALIDPTQSQAGQGPTAAAPPGGDTSSPYLPLTVLPDRAWNPALTGHDVRLTVVAASTSGPVLAVPAAAVQSDLAGRTTVTVITPGAGRRVVRVTAGVTADNLVEITAVSGTLSAGDQVLVGQ
jgi:hypothetical protein